MAEITALQVRLRPDDRLIEIVREGMRDDSDASYGEWDDYVDEYDGSINVTYSAGEIKGIEDVEYAARMWMSDGEDPTDYIDFPLCSLEKRQSWDKDRGEYVFEYGPKLAPAKAFVADKLDEMLRAHVVWQERVGKLLPTYHTERVAFIDAWAEAIVNG